MPYGGFDFGADRIADKIDKLRQERKDRKALDSAFDAVGTATEHLTKQGYLPEGIYDKYMMAAQGGSEERKGFLTGLSSIMGMMHQVSEEKEASARTSEMGARTKILSSQEERLQGADKRMQEFNARYAAAAGSDPNFMGPQQPTTGMGIGRMAAQAGVLTPDDLSKFQAQDQNAQTFANTQDQLARQREFNARVAAAAGGDPNFMGPQQPMSGMGLARMAAQSGIGNADDFGKFMGIDERAALLADKKAEEQRKLKFSERLGAGLKTAAGNLGAKDVAGFAAEAGLATPETYGNLMIADERVAAAKQKQDALDREAKFSELLGKAMDESQGTTNDPLTAANITRIAAQAGIADPVQIGRLQSYQSLQQQFTPQEITLPSGARAVTTSRRSAVPVKDVPGRSGNLTTQGRIQIETQIAKLQASKGNPVIKADTELMVALDLQIQRLQKMLDAGPATNAAPYFSTNAPAGGLTNAPAPPYARTNTSSARPSASTNLPPSAVQGAPPGKVYMRSKSGQRGLVRIEDTQDALKEGYTFD